MKKFIILSKEIRKEIKNSGRNVAITLVILLLSYFAIFLTDWPKFDDSQHKELTIKLRKVLYFFKLAPLFWLIAVPFADYYSRMSEIKISSKRMKSVYSFFYPTFGILAILMVTPFLNKGAMSLIENNIAFFSILIVTILITWFFDSEYLKYLNRTYSTEYFNDVKKKIQGEINFVKTSCSDDKATRDILITDLETQFSKAELREKIVESEKLFCQRIVTYADRLIFWCLIATAILFTLTNSYLGWDISENQSFVNADIFFEGFLSFQAIMSTALYLTISATFTHKINIKK
jgi:hypothetical protein